MVKNIVNKLWECISNSSEYSFGKDPLPIFYVLYANYLQANLFDIVPFDEYRMSKSNSSDREIDLLGRFSDLADDSIEAHKKLFEEFNKSIRSVYKIDRDDYNCKYDYHTYRYHFKDIVDFFIDKYAECIKMPRPIQLREFNQEVISCFVLLDEQRYVYDYDCGIGDMAIESEDGALNDYMGFEKDETLYLISQIRMIAHDLSSRNISEYEFNNEEFSYNTRWGFYSFPRFDDEKLGKSFDVFIEDEYTYGAFVLPMEFCYSSEYRKYREYISEHKMLETVMYLPKGTFSYYDKESVILFLSKIGRDPNIILYTDYMPSYFTLIDGRKILRNGQVDFTRMGEILTDVLWNMNPDKDLRESSSPRVWRHIPKNEDTLRICVDNMLPSAWFNYMDRVDNRELYDEYSIGQFLSLSDPVEEIKDSSAMVVEGDDFVDINMVDSYVPSMLKVGSVPSSYLGYRGNSLVVRHNKDGVKLCLVETDDVFYTASSDLVFGGNEDMVHNWLYLCKMIVSSCKVDSLPELSHIDSLDYEFLSDVIPYLESHGNGIKDDMKAYLYVLKDICEQKNFKDKRDIYLRLELISGVLNGFYSTKVFLLKNSKDQAAYLKMLKEEYRTLKAEEAEDRRREAAKEASSDIAHMMGLSFQEILTCADSFKEIPEKRAEAEAIIANIEYMRRILTTLGTDISRYAMDLKPTGVNKFFREYLDSWKRLGRAIYNIEFTSDLLDDVKADFDKTLMSIMMDAILENARRHGFHKKDSEDNLVMINISASDDAKGVIVKVKNSGAPLPADFSLSRFITRGETMGVSGNTGIGGYHIYHIVRKHGGALDVYSDNEKHTVVKIYIPIL